MTRPIVFCGLLCLLLCIGQAGFTQVVPQPRGYFSLSLDGGFGYYGEGQWSRNNEQRAFRRDRGLHDINDAGLTGFSARLSFARVTKNRKLRWGASIYRSWASTTIDTVYTAWVDGRPTDAPSVIFDKYNLSDNVWYPNLFIEPRLWHNGRWSLAGHVSLGLGFLEDEGVMVPFEGNAVWLQTRRASSHNLLELQNALGGRLDYRVNPYYTLFFSTRYNWLVSTQTTELVEGALGIELNLRKGGVPTAN